MNDNYKEIYELIIDFDAHGARIKALAPRTTFFPTVEKKYFLLISCNKRVT